MAITTKTDLRSRVLYSVFVRNHSERGDFEGVRQDLPRIRDLGADIIWLMPIHPIGEMCRKGTCGSPYAIRDYRAIDPAYGTEEDLRRLTEEAHRLGMRLIIDVVYNHTSPDSVLAKEHPEWFWKRPDGTPGNRVGDWTDIIDLDYRCRDLWDYQAETLCHWAGIVDGFRCDVAPLVPLVFWQYARERVGKINPDCLWLAESVETSFVRDMRAAGCSCLSDSEIFQAFDISYEYDSYPLFLDYLEGKCSLQTYADRINLQESIYPENYVKLRFLENHDKPRAAFLIPDARQRRNWTAFLFFQKGLPMLYAGQESGAAHLPELFEKDSIEKKLFEKDPIEIEINEEYDLIRRLCAIHHRPEFNDSRYEIKALPGDIILAEHSGPEGRLLGIFSVKGNSGVISVDLPDGRYRNLLNDEYAEVKLGRLPINGEPVITCLDAPHPFG